MAGISFGKTDALNWIVAGWAFRQVLKDIRAHPAADQDIASALNHAEDIGFLFVDDLPEPLRSRMTRLIGTVCREMLDGSHDSTLPHEPFGDAATQRMYREGIEMLQAAVSATGSQTG